jgi:hypothetical protein
MYGKNTPHEYIEKMAEITDQLEKEMKDKVMNVKEEKAMIAPCEIENLIEKYKDPTDIEGYQNQLILTLYTAMEPLRLDWAEVLLTPSATENNYSVKDKTLFLKNYKTSNTYGEMSIKLSPPVAQLIEKYLEYRQSQGINSPYLLINPTNKDMMTRANLNKWLGKIFGEGRGVNILRKYYISRHIDAEKVLEEEKMAKNMCHSVAIQRKNYVKKIK